jgi:hypothetical protein
MNAFNDARLTAAAAATIYPATPDLWGGVRRRLTQAPVGRASSPVRRLAIGMAVLLLAFAAGLAAAPQARAALLKTLQAGVVRIFFPLASPTPTSPSTSITQPTATPEVLAPPLDLAGRTTLAEATEALGQPVLLPGYPGDIGAPEIVFLQDWEGPLVILVWTREDDPIHARLALHILGPDTFAGKGEPSVVATTTVSGHPALWTQGPHLLSIQSGSDVLRSLVTGNVLVWEQDGLTYRLETDGPMSEAVRIAESLR